MISKCENVVINRVKFSEFEGFDPAAEGVDGLKLVGYIENEDGKRNISIDFGALLKKNGEIANIGAYIHAGNISETSSPVSINKICDRTCGLKIDDNTLAFIQISGLSTTSGIIDSDNTLDIAFATESYAVGQEIAVLFEQIPGSLILYSRATGQPFYSGDVALPHVDVFTRFIKIDGVSPSIIPVETYIGANNKFFTYVSSTPVDVPSPIDFIDDVSASKKYVNNKIQATEDKLSADFSAADEVVKTGLETLVNDLDNELTQKIDDINSAIEGNDNDLAKILHVEKFASLEELQNAAETMDSHKLSRLIALVNQGEADAYAEYICLNPDKTGETKQFHLLGDADTVFASDESEKTHGSVVLVSNIDEEILNTEKYGTISATNNQYKAAKGYALSPIALIDIYKKHKETTESINSEIDSINKEISSTKTELKEEIGSTKEELKNEISFIKEELEIDDDIHGDHQSRIEKLEKQIVDNSSETSNAIDEIRAAIGLDGCVDGCTCTDKNCCSTAGKCSILCRVSENERDISSLNDEILKVNAKSVNNARQIEETLSKIDENKAISDATFNGLAEAIDTKFEERDSNIATLSDLIEKNSANIEKNVKDIKANGDNLGNLFTKLSIAESEIISIKDKNTSIDGEISTIKTNITSQESAINNLLTENIRIQSTLEANKLASDTAIAKIDANLGVIDNRITNNFTDIKKLSENLSSLVQQTAKINELEHKLTQKIEPDLTAVQNGLSEVNKGVYAANERADKAVETANSATNDAEQAIERANQAIASAAAATTAAGDAAEIANNAVGLATEAEEHAEAAKIQAEAANDTIQEIIATNQKSHTFCLNYAAGSESGNFEITYSEIFRDIDDSALFNISVISTTVDGIQIIPTITYGGSIDDNGADNRIINVSTGIVNALTTIVVHAYARNLHIREMN